jgi:signal transduction histidine kinase
MHHIHQLLMNLCMNAIQAMPEEGRLEVRVPACCSSKMKSR